MGFSFLRLFRTLWQYVNILSLDVATGAVVSALFFAELLHQDLYPQGRWVMGSTVWLIYTVDHLLDGRKIKHPASSARHRFHQRYFKELLLAVSVMAVINLMVVSYVRIPVWKAGLPFALLVGAYLVASRYLTWAKELVAGMLYTGGVLLPSWAVGSQNWTSGQIIVALCFLLIAWMNLILFAQLSIDEDLRDGQTSVATRLGLSGTRILQMTLFILVVGGVLGSPSVSWNLRGVELAMAALTVAICWLPLFRLKTEGVRFVGEAIFFLPLLAIGR